MNRQTATKQYPPPLSNRRRLSQTLLLALLALFWGMLLLPATASANDLALDVAISDDPVVRGQRFFYRLAVTNTSTTPLEGVRVQLVVPTYVSVRRNDVIGAGSICASYTTIQTCSAGQVLTLSVGTLLPGVSREIQIPTVVSSDIQAADLPVLIQANFVASSTSSSANREVQVDIPVVQFRPLDVKLSATPVPMAPNGELEYTVTFANSGSVAATAVQVELELPTDVEVLEPDGGQQVGNRLQWTVAQLSAGRSERRRVKLRDTQDGDSRRLVVVAQINDGVNPVVRTTWVTPVLTARPLALELALSDDPVQRGQRFFYRLTATNTRPSGGAPLEGVRVQLIVPTPVSISTGGIIGAGSGSSGGLLRLNLGTLLPGESREVQIPAVVDSDAAFGSLSTSWFLGDYTDITGEFAVASETLTVVQSRPLDVKLSATPAPMVPNGELEYTVTFANSGSVAATAVQVELELPAGVEVLETYGGQQVGNRLQWTVAELSAGRSERRRVKLRDTQGGESRRLAVAAQIDDGVNPAVRTTWVTPAALTARPLALELALSDDPVQRGQRFFYRLTATNTHPAGEAPLEGVRVRWVVPTPVSVRRSNVIGAGSICASYTTIQTCSAGQVLTLNLGTLLPGESREVQIPAVVASDAVFGHLSTSWLLGDYTGIIGERAVVSETLTVVQSRPLDVKLSAAPVPISPGGTLEYTLMVANSGSTAVNDQQLELALPEGVSVVAAAGGQATDTSLVWPIARLGSGQGIQYQIELADSLGVDGRLLAAEAQLRGATDSVRTRAITTSRSHAPLVIVASADISPLQPATAFNYRLAVSHIGLASDAALEDVRVRLVVPNHVSVNRSQIIGAGQSGSGSSGGLLTLTLGTLQPGDTRQVTIPTTVASGTPRGSLVDARFQGSASFPNGDRVQQVVEPLTLLVGEFAAAAPNTYPLSVNKMGVGGSGTVTSNPEGINCGNVCQAEFTEGTSVTLTAQPASGSSFSGWSGACSGTGSCTVTMDQARSVTARFGLIDDLPDGVRQLQQAYLTYYGRAADSAGLNFWLDNLAQGQGAAEIQADFGSPNQAEFVAIYGEAVSNDAFFDRAYQNILNRAPDAEGKAYWLETIANLEARNLSQGQNPQTALAYARAEVLQAILDAALLNAEWDADVVNNKVALAALITERSATWSGADQAALINTTRALLADPLIGDPQVFADLQQQVIALTPSPQTLASSTRLSQRFVQIASADDHRLPLNGEVRS